MQEQKIKNFIALVLIAFACVLSFCIVNDNPYINGALIIAAIFSSCMVVAFYMDKFNL